jgi:hypothetical protein
MLLCCLERTELCVVGGGVARVETVHWDVVIRVMTRVLKDQWISIAIASMSLIGLFWLELGVW